MAVFADSTGMQVKVPAGSAVLQGFIFTDDAQETLSVGTANATNPRIDRLVVRRDFGAKTVDYFVRVGTPAGSPSPPALQRDASVWEISLAQITVPANASTIAAGNIADERFSPDVCGAVSPTLAGVIECTSATRPTTGVVNGTTIIEMDTGSVRFWYNGAWSAPLVTGTGALVSPNISGTVAGAAIYTTPTLAGFRMTAPAYQRVSSAQDIGQASTQIGNVRWFKAWGADVTISATGSGGFNGPGTVSSTFVIKNGDAVTFIAGADNFWDAI